MCGLEMRKAKRAFTWVYHLLFTRQLTLDPYENLYCQIVGCKTFRLVPPTEYACLKGSFINFVRKQISFLERRFPSARWILTNENPTQFILDPQDSTMPWLTVDPSLLNVFKSDDITRACRPLEVTLQPGEVLYLPALWFHAVSQSSNSHGLCMAVNYWYNMDFSGQLYSMFNFLRNVTLLEDGRPEEIQLDPE